MTIEITCLESFSYHTDVDSVARYAQSRGAHRATRCLPSPLLGGASVVILPVPGVRMRAQDSKMKIC
jgi:hypothetical protein